MHRWKKDYMQGISSIRPALKFNGIWLHRSLLDLGEPLATTDSLRVVPRNVRMEDL